MPDDEQKYLKAYSDETNQIQNFIADRCRKSPDAVCRTSTLYEAYKNYCKDNCLFAHSMTAFSKAIACVKGIEHHSLTVRGVRRGELLGLKWGNVDFENNRIYICKSILYTPDIGVYEETTKTLTSKRYISLPCETMSLLKDYKKWQEGQIEYFMGYYQDKGYVFAQDNGNPMCPDSVTDYLSKFSQKYNLPHINPHAFRHTMASLLYYNGADSVSISNGLGHAQVSTTANIYAHIINDADCKNAELLSNIMSRKNG